MAGMVIVGAGECGTRAAFALREAGYDGPVTLVGAEEHLPYERPPLSKPEGLVAQAKQIATPDRYSDAEISLKLGVGVVSIDRAAKTVTLGDGSSIGYDKLLLATGTQPRKLPVDRDGVARYFRTLDDATACFKAAENSKGAILIGAGLIGLELAAVLRDRGIDVSVIEVGPRALGRAVPEQIAETIVARHRAAGVEFHFGTGISSIAANGIVLDDGTTVAGDLIVAAIGVVPDTALAETAGLAIENGVAVDEYLQTSDPDIYAAGDCAAVIHPFFGHRLRLESWRNAQDQGAAAAANMAGQGVAFDAVPWFWSDQYDLGLQIAGLPDQNQEAVVRELSPDARIICHLGDDGRLMAASGIGPGNSVAKDIRLCEMLIAKGVKPDTDSLSDPTFNLKKMLRG